MTRAPAKTASNKLPPAGSGCSPPTLHQHQPPSLCPYLEGFLPRLSQSPPSICKGEEVFADNPSSWWPLYPVSFSSTCWWYHLLPFNSELHYVPLRISNAGCWNRFTPNSHLPQNIIQSAYSWPAKPSHDQSGFPKLYFAAPPSLRSLESLLFRWQMRKESTGKVHPLQLYNSVSVRFLPIVPWNNSSFSFVAV